MDAMRDRCKGKKDGMESKLAVVEAGFLLPDHTLPASQVPLAPSGGLIF